MKFFPQARAGKIAPRRENFGGRGKIFRAGIDGASRSK